MLGNRYQLGNEVGAGGMGTVYLGTDSQSQQTVAIKRLKGELVPPELMERFKREGEALRELNHPNIVKLLDAIEHDGVHYLVMEYVSGGDLSDLLKNGKLPIERCLKLSLDLADALTRAHKLDIIHRDLKPANVLIAEDGTLRLTDFGVAHIGKKQRVTDTDAIVGTVDYLAPETLDGGEVDPRADIWAFGVMLFEMLTGERPFHGDSIAQTLMAIMTQPTPDLENLRPDASIALVDLVYRMLEKDRNTRIRTVRHIGAALEDILSGNSDNTPPETRFAPDTPAMLHRPKHNLPAQTTPFVGREAELLEVAKLIENPKIRLVTILAPGGMGKTRLALEAAKQQIAHFENGVYFVELAPLSDPANIVTAIAESVSYQFQSDGREPKQQILDFLSNKNLLLILDNFEHLLDGASLVTAILNAASDVQILATSRQRLSQTGESLFHLAGMDFPKWETPKDALEYAAVKLFMNSALRAQPTFELTSDNLDYVARICRLVQGMPLGIVLAAAWLAMLSPHEIADEIQQGIDFLMNEAGEVPARQQSIRAVFDYSWQQMTDDEQQVFMKLSVFRGGFTREAAQEVAGANLRTLMSLINKSLIRRDVDSGRYEIHELLRQYSESRLHEANQFEAAKAAHSHYFTDFIVPLSEETFWIADFTILETVRADFENVRTTWHSFIDNRQFDKLPTFLNALWIFFDSYSRTREGIDLFESILDKLTGDSDEMTLLRGKTLALLCWFNVDNGRHSKAIECGSQAINLLDSLGTTEALLQAIMGLSIAYGFEGKTLERRALSKRGLELARQVNNLKWIGLYSYGVGMEFLGDGNYEEGLKWIDKMPGNLHVLVKGSVLNDLGDYTQARVLLLEAWAFMETRKFRFGLITTSSKLVNNALLTEDYEGAWFYLRRGLQYADDEAYTWIALDLLPHAITLLIKQRKYAESVEVFSYIVNHPNVMLYTRETVKQHEAILKVNLSADDYAVAWEQGKMLDLQTVVKQLTDEFAASEK